MERRRGQERLATLGAVMNGSRVELRSMLYACQLPLTIYHAKRLLERIQSLGDYLMVYRHYFPTAYAESMEQVRLGQAPLFPPFGEAYSPHEVRLLKLIDEHLFPLPLWEVLEDTREEYRCTTIPVEPFGIDLTISDDFLELDLGWQLIYYLIGEIQVEFFHFSDERETLFALPLEEGKVDDTSLRTVCEREREPLAFFRHVIDLIAHDTGTVWLDATAEAPCTTANWSISTIDELARQYEEAVVLKEKTDQFINWLEGDIMCNFTEVIRIWNECILLTKKQEEMMASVRDQD
ncbi:hypothetical protein [Reticulibacter mediterranei]|uniref:hypothetical protein n=1 Tax=Reticulibacter mediterranei TaxID=2778369 RepID=UPI001C68AB69|nr:hypothetical protein [Reticulibacter mediterranei]